MKALLSMLILSAIILGDSFAQKPTWIDNPGTYAYENFVAIGISKDKKVDKAREKAQKKVTKGIEKILKAKYAEKDIKKAMASLRFEAYWLDPVTNYTYCLGLLPIETIDKNYAAQKNLLKAKASALDAVKSLNEINKDPDIIIIRAEDEGESVDSETESTTRTDVKTDETTTITDDKTITTGSEKKTEPRTILAKDKSLGEFKWLDQDGNSKYEFLGNNLVVTVGTNETFIPEEGNKNAPRFELPNISGNYVMTAKVSCDWAKYYNAGFGLTALSGKSNIRTYLLYNGSWLYMKGFGEGVELPASEKGIEPLKGFVFLKLVKQGYTFTSYYSSIADDWIEIGSFETAFPETVSLGLFFLNETESAVQFKVESVSITQ